MLAFCHLPLAVPIPSSCFVLLVVASGDAIHVLDQGGHSSVQGEIWMRHRVAPTISVVRHLCRKGAPELGAASMLDSLAVAALQLNDGFPTCSKDAVVQNAPALLSILSVS